MLTLCPNGIRFTSENKSLTFHNTYLYNYTCPRPIYFIFGAKKIIAGKYGMYMEIVQEKEKFYSKGYTFDTSGSKTEFSTIIDVISSSDYVFSDAIKHVEGIIDNIDNSDITEPYFECLFNVTKLMASIKPYSSSAILSIVGSENKSIFRVIQGVTTLYEETHHMSIKTTTEKRSDIHFETTIDLVNFKIFLKNIPANLGRIGIIPNTLWLIRNVGFCEFINIIKYL